MIRQEVIAFVIDSQQAVFHKQELGLIRDTLSIVPVADSFATIITGLRRCGKSTLLMQLLDRDYNEAIYLNSDDIRLSGFDSDDFVRLHNEIVKRGIKVLFFDEIQIISGWEKFINQLLREGYRVFITGSNASLLSTELGTYLTGRHLSVELFPFSYAEYIRFNEIEKNEESLISYIKKGGIPEYVKTGISFIMNSLVDDILIRDIAVRHSVRDVVSLRQLTSYLITNIGNPVSANKLVGIFGIKSATTVLEYFAYLKESYLFEFVPIFNHSLKIQARNSKKVYVMDLGFYTENSVSTSENMGRRLENLIYLHLRRKSKKIFYYKERGECDFIVMEKNEVKAAIQVCLTLNDENFEREYRALFEAMQSLNLNEGLIITLNQTDLFKENNMQIRVLPAHEFLTM